MHVCDDGVRRITHPPTSQLKAPRKIGVFVVKEERRDRTSRRRGRRARARRPRYPRRRTRLRRRRTDRRPARQSLCPCRSRRAPRSRRCCSGDRHVAKHHLAGDGADPMRVGCGQGCEQRGEPTRLTGRRPGSGRRQRAWLPHVRPSRRLRRSRCCDPGSPPEHRSGARQPRPRWRRSTRCRSPG